MSVPSRESARQESAPTPRGPSPAGTVARATGLAPWATPAKVRAALLPRVQGLTPHPREGSDQVTAGRCFQTRGLSVHLGWRGSWGHLFSPIPTQEFSKDDCRPGSRGPVSHWIIHFAVVCSTCSFLGLVPDLLGQPLLWASDSLASSPGSSLRGVGAGTFQKTSACTRQTVG